MKKGFIAVLAVLTVFAIIGCSNSSGSTLEKVKVTFNLNYSSAPAPVVLEVEKGKSFGNAFPARPTRADYTFSKWTEDREGEGTAVTQYTVFQANTTVYAQWTEGEVVGGLELDPWAPDENPPEPATGYKNFYGSVTDPEDWMYTTFAGTGNVGSIEANGDGTYTVTIKTNPGGISIVSFNDSDYMFKNGYYLLLDFPENTEAKPIMALTGAATGSQNDTGQDWQSLYNVNRNPDIQGYVPILDDVYLAGEIAFARDDLDTLYKSIVLTLVWHEDEEAEYYEFTLKKILITDGEDLTPPDTTTMTPWTPEPEIEPADWITFPDDETIAGTFYPWDEANGISGNTVSVISNAGGRSLVRIFGDEFKYQKGYYLSVTLPNNSVKPQKIYALPITGSEHDGDWGGSTLVEAPATDKFIAGRADFTWANDESTSGYTGVILDIYWYAGQPDALYTFTVNKILFAEEYTPPSDPLEAYTPPAVAAPGTYINFPGSEDLKATYYPWATGTTGTAITAAKEATGRTLVRLSGDTFTYKKGIYVSVTLPNDSFQPRQIVLYGSTDKLDSGIVWGTETIVAAPAGKFLAGKVDLYWDGSALETALQGIILDIYWHDGQAAGAYSFTIDSIKVAEESTEAPPAEVPVIHDSSQLEDATYTVGATAAHLVVVPAWTNNSADYTYEWWKAESADADWPATYYKWNGDGNNTEGQGVYIIPPTDVVGTSYYYCVVAFGSEKTLTRIVTITVE